MATEPTCNDCGRAYFDHRYAKCSDCLNRLVRVANGQASPADLAAYLGYTALKLAASLNEFGDDVSASAEWIEYLGDAEHRLDTALGLTDAQLPSAETPTYLGHVPSDPAASLSEQRCERCGQPVPCEVRRLLIHLGEVHRRCLLPGGTSCRVCLGTWLGSDAWPERDGHHPWCPVLLMIEVETASGEAGTKLPPPELDPAFLDRLAQVGYEAWHLWFRRREVERGTRMVDDTRPWSWYRGDKEPHLEQARAVVAAFLIGPDAPTPGLAPTDPPWVTRGYDEAIGQWARCTDCQRRIVYPRGQGNFPGRPIEHEDDCAHAEAVRQLGAGRSAR